MGTQVPSRLGHFLPQWETEPHRLGGWDPTVQVQLIESLFDQVESVHLPVGSCTDGKSIGSLSGGWVKINDDILLS